MRRHIDIMADLLKYIVEEGQWADEKNTACHCHPCYEHCCASCGVLRGEYHDAHCSLRALMIEARAYLEVENELIEKANEAKAENEDYEDTVYIPYID